MEEKGIEVGYDNKWALRSITRDVKWGIPLPQNIDPAMNEKTFYVWPESLLAPIGFTQLALKNKGLDPNSYKDYWCDPDAKIMQFVGVDCIFFYVIMQGAMWFGVKNDIHSFPKKGEFKLTDVMANYHLNVNGEKMSKSAGNFITADQLIDEYGYHPDQLRYFLSILSLNKKPSNFDFQTLNDRNEFLAGPLNAAFEKPISACHNKFNSVVPDGQLVDKSISETKKMIQVYMRSMEKADYPDLLYLIESYARIINKLFNKYRPHDDRHNEQERTDALYSSFLILKNLLIMLYPFVPTTMEKLRLSLNLTKDVYSISELGKPIEAGHKVGELVEFFPKKK